MRSYICFYRSIGEKKCREWSGSLGGSPGGDPRVVGGGDVADAFDDSVGDIRLSKKTQGDIRLVFAAAKSPRAFPRIS